MLKISGDNWSGTILVGDTSKASGCINGYSWYLQFNANTWFVEIAEDQSIEPNDLPLVGYGCGGWLYKCDTGVAPVNEDIILLTIHKHLSFVFTLFNENKLQYLPAVTCPCRD